jgi:hypothetical protein
VDKEFVFISSRCFSVYELSIVQVEIYLSTIPSETSMAWSRSASFEPMPTMPSDSLLVHGFGGMY